MINYIFYFVNSYKNHAGFTLVNALQQSPSDSFNITYVNTHIKTKAQTDDLGLRDTRVYAECKNIN